MKFHIQDRLATFCDVNLVEEAIKQLHMQHNLINRTYYDAVEFSYSPNRKWPEKKHKINN